MFAVNVRNHAAGANHPRDRKCARGLVIFGTRHVHSRSSMFTAGLWYETCESPVLGSQMRIATAMCLGVAPARHAFPWLAQCLRTQSVCKHTRLSNTTRARQLHAEQLTALAGCMHVTPYRSLDIARLPLPFPFASLHVHMPMYMWPGNVMTHEVMARLTVAHESCIHATTQQG